MTIHDPNTTLLQASKGTPSDQTPAPLAGPAQSVSFALQNVAPPSDVYITRDDQLFISAMSALAAETVTVRYRILDPTGKISVNQQVINFPTAYNNNTNQIFFAMEEGFLLSLGVISSLAQKRGQTFVRVGIGRGQFGLANIVHVLVADYVSSGQPIAWPGTGVFDTTDRNGALRRIQPGNPAAGADWTLVSPANVRWVVRGVTALLTTAVAVANRNPRLFWTSDVTNVNEQLIPVATDQTASLAITYSVGSSPITTTAAGATSLWAAMTPIMIENTGRIGTNTANIQAADQWSNIVVDVEEWLLGI